MIFSALHSPPTTHRVIKFRRVGNWEKGAARVDAPVLKVCLGLFMKFPQGLDEDALVNVGKIINRFLVLLLHQDGALLVRGQWDKVGGQVGDTKVVRIEGRILDRSDPFEHFKALVASKVANDGLGVAGAGVIYAYVAIATPPVADLHGQGETS